MTDGGAWRLPQPWGSLIDRDRSVSFLFDGKGYQGFEGDTVASALAANGRLLLSRSFKYHRPRAALSFAGLDANSYVRVADEPNVLADMLPASEGLVANSQNRIGSLDRDLAVHAGRFSRFLPVGFYYRAFFRPKGIWAFWEGLFRRAAGLGKIDTHSARGYFDKQYLFADVAVIGAGPAGLSAALAAARGGADVLLIEEAPVLGGSLNYARFQSDRSSIDALRQDLLQQVAQESNIRVLAGATCSGWFPDNWLSISQSKRLYKLRATYVIACTGSVEQPMVFRNNDLPGVLPASGVQRLMRLYGVCPGRQAVVVTANAEGYDVALDLIEAGVKVSAIINLGPCANAALLENLRAKGVPVHDDCAVTEAVPGPGLRSITGVVVTKLMESGDASGDSWSIDCDLLVTSVGYAPLGQLACHAGGRLVYDDELNSFVVRNRPQNSRLAGSVNHCYPLDSALADGRSAGADIAHALQAGAAVNSVATPSAEAAGVNHPYPIFPHRLGKDFVDFDEDQTVADLQNAVADGFDHPELAKRYSTVGMGPSQGRLSSLNALRIVQTCSDNDISGASVTTQRPPFRPLSFGVLAGRSFEPERLTPMHQWHADNGAEFMPAGLWKRPAYYAGDADRSATIAAEVAAIRNNVAVIDVSTLGGIELRGPDAAEFLDRMYTFAYRKQPTGRARYLLMTDNTGAVIDDGVACRLSDEHFYVTATTTGADAVYRSMLRHNAEWRLKIDLINVTSTYAGISIAGPNSRRVMDKTRTDMDFSRTAFPYLGVHQGNIEGIPVIAVRVGFVGELGYELHVPWSKALALWETLFSAGEGLGIRPVGVEAQRILRLEKGHVIIGQDTDGLTMPRDAALDWAVAANKPYFIGKPAIGFSLEREGSRRLVGFRLLNADDPLPEESQLVIRDGAIVGRVTSIARSEVLGDVIGLAYVAEDQAEPGTNFEIKVGSKQLVTAETVPIPFYDPGNARQAL